MHYGSYLFGLHAIFLMILHFPVTLISKTCRSACFLTLTWCVCLAQRGKNCSFSESYCLSDKRYKTVGTETDVSAQNTQKELFTEVHLGLNTQT